MHTEQVVPHTRRPSEPSRRRGIDGPSRHPMARMALAAGLILGGLSMLAVPTGATSGDAPITGTIYRDLDANGAKGANEPPQAGVTVIATDSSGATATATSGADGSYSLDVASLDAGPFRVEFSGWPKALQPAPHGTGNPTSVTTAIAGAKLDFGVQDPNDYCQSNPTMAVSCFVSGAGATSLETVAAFPYSAGTTETSAHNQSVPGPAGFDTPNESTVATAGETGSVWGEGWHAQSASLYLGAFAKKYVPFGPSGSGAIYLQHGAAAPTLFYSTGSTANRTVAGANWYLDPWSNEIGKYGWGDLDVAGNQLFAVNLEDRNLYVFDLDPTTGAMIGAGPVAKVAIPAPIGSAADSRPFGLGVRDGLVYVGGVDSEETGGGTPSAWVQSFDPSTDTFAADPVISFRLDYNLGCAYVATAPGGQSQPRCAGAALGSTEQTWRRWGAPRTSNDTPTFSGPLTVSEVDRTEIDPQPELTGISFDDDGDLSLGFRDRWGDQSGRFIPGGNVANPISPALGQVPVVLNTYTFGDTLRAAKTGTATWTLEHDGTSGGVTGAANSGKGPGGGNFYSADQSLYNVVDNNLPLLEGHENVTTGGTYHKPGTDELATTAYDVFGRWDNLGVRWMTNTGKDAPLGRNSTDLNTRAYDLYEGQPTSTPFGKANGLGDLEALCDQAPLELGNYVWYDANGNGQQDAGESAIPGVTVTLSDSDGTVVSTAVTDATGQYFFESPNSANLPASPGPSVGIVPGGVQPGTAYSIHFDASTADTTGLGVDAAQLGLTTQRVGSGTTDSDPAIATGIVAFTTGGPGANNHTFDAGYVDATQVLPTTTINTQTDTATAVPVKVLDATTVPSVKVQDKTELAVTGTDSQGVTLIGVGLVICGLGLIVGTRRRGLL